MITLSNSYAAKSPSMEATSLTEEQSSQIQVTEILIPEIPEHCYTINEDLKNCIVGTNIFNRFVFGDCADLIKEQKKCKILLRKVKITENRLRSKEDKERMLELQEKNKNRDPKHIFDGFEKIGPFGKGRNDD